jgi:hypothetical protein
VLVRAGLEIFVAMDHVSFEATTDQLGRQFVEAVFCFREGELLVHFLIDKEIFQDYRNLTSHPSHSKLAGFNAYIIKV